MSPAPILTLIPGTTRVSAAAALAERTGQRLWRFRHAGHWRTAMAPHGLPGWQPLNVWRREAA